MPVLQVPESFVISRVTPLPSLFEGNDKTEIKSFGSAENKSNKNKRLLGGLAVKN